MAWYRTKGAQGRLMATAPKPGPKAGVPTSTASGPSAFATQVLKDLKITNPNVTPVDIKLLNAQQTAEGQWGVPGSWNASTTNNPFNLESVAPGSPTPKGSHTTPQGNSILTFGTPAQGAAATADFISSYNPNVLAALRKGNTKQFLSPSGVGGWVSKTSPTAQSQYSQLVSSSYGQPVPTLTSAVTPSSSGGSGGNILTKIGYWTLGALLIGVGLVVLFHNNGGTQWMGATIKKVGMPEESGSGPVGDAGEVADVAE